MARIIALIPDLLFGSRVLAELSAAGHEVQLVSALEPDAPGEVLIVDLTADARERIESVRDTAIPKKLAFYAHVESDVRLLAHEHGFDVVVPRSRMARDASALVEQLLR